MPDTTEPVCHWERVQRRWKWEWASYQPHLRLFWTDGPGGGTTELVDDATLAHDPPELKVDLCYGSRWEKVSGTGTNVVVGSADLPESQSPVGEGWHLVETLQRA